MRLWKCQKHSFYSIFRAVSVKRITPDTYLHTGGRDNLYRGRHHVIQSHTHTHTRLLRWMTANTDVSSDQCQFVDDCCVKPHSGVSLWPVVGWSVVTAEAVSVG